jgi:hypothetical protein
MLRSRTPPLPIDLGFAQERSRKLVDIVGDALVGTNNEGKRPIEREFSLVQNVVQRGVGGQSQNRGIAKIANMVAAHRDLRVASAVLEGGTQTQRDARPARYRLEAAHQHGRPEHASEATEARREVEDARRPAGALYGRLENRRVGKVALAAFLDAVEDRVHVAGLRVVAAQQGIEDRIAV